MNKITIFIVVAIAIIIVGAGILTLNPFSSKSEQNSTSYPVYYSSLGKIIVRTNFPDTPSNIPLFRVSPQNTDMIQYRVPTLIDFRENVTSEIDAPSIAQQVIAQHGGFPPGASLSNVKTIFTEQSGNKIPMMTQVQFTRSLDGMPVVGQGGRLSLSLGENGELLELNKIWRTVNRSGTVRIIPVTTAFEKITQGDILGDRLKCICDLNVDSIKLGYFEKGYNVTQEFVDPVWIFSGTTSSGDSWSYYVYAWQFANFSASSTTGNVPLRVTFIDSSEITPKRWLWDFGDGMNSTEQNPVHTYQNVGFYNVTLTVWNDLGSDSIQKNCISVISNQSQKNNVHVAESVGQITPTEGKV